MPRIIGICFVTEHTGRWMLLTGSGICRNANYSESEMANGDFMLSLTRSHVSQLLRASVHHSNHVPFTTTIDRTMGKNKKKFNTIPPETYLRLPALADASLAAQPIIDTHTHLVSTFSTYRSKYKNGTLYNIHDFVREMYRDRNVRAIVDVWCEAPVLPTWREIADSALTPEDRAEKWGGIDYWFVMGERS